jgi:hypothetical protein
MNRPVLVAAAAVLWAVAGLGVASAQDAPPGVSPPSWQVLKGCADKPSDAEVLACFRAAMREAGYKPSSEVASAKRRQFGLPLPTLHKHAKPVQPSTEVAQAAPAAGPSEPSSQAAPAAPRPAPAAEPEASDEDSGHITVTLSDVGLIPPLNRLLLVTTDGAVWKQTDDETVSPTPKPGQSFQILKNAFGGYFCKFDKRNMVRCVRSH